MTLQAKIPGIKGKHAIVTQACRVNKGKGGAFDDAIRQLKEEYVACVNLPANEAAKFHFVMTVDRNDAPGGWGELLFLAVAHMPPGGSAQQVSIASDSRVINGREELDAWASEVKDQIEADGYEIVNMSVLVAPGQPSSPLNP